MVSKYDINFLSHPLNKKNVNKFINESDIEVRDIVKKIIKNTKHISYIDFTLSLIKITNKFIKFVKEEKKDKIYVYQNKYNRYKSNYWILLFLIDLFKKMKVNIEIIVFDTLSNIHHDNDIIVFLDDCIYSGQQMNSSLLSVFSYTIKTSLNICLLVPYISTIGKDLILNSLKKNKNLNVHLFYYKELKENTSTILNKKEIDLIESYYPDEDDISNNFKDKYLIYFDHKLADGISTLTLFYNGLNPTFYNKFLLEKMITEKDIHKKKLIENKLLLNLIPLISNCDHIKSLDVAEPECPKPPYKLNYSKFIKQFKEKKIIKSL